MRTSVISGTYSAYLLLLTALPIAACSIAIAQNYTPTPNDTLQSPSIAADGHITFRVYAPKAADVKLGGTDIPETLKGGMAIRYDNGVWELTAGPLPPGSYRYNYLVDNVQVIDPRSSVVSESNMNLWSLVHVPGAEFMDTRDVPHGAVSEITYHSTSLGGFRRMHVYTPPGYSSGDDKYPVLYLLHGAYDCDDSWSSVGRAGFIIDNLIADKKAVPMVVIMPAGHTNRFAFQSRSRHSSQPRRDEFVEDFIADIRPYAEEHYRLLGGRKNRAIAGLSMGGAQTLDIAIAHLADFSYIGVFSSGLFELGRMNTANGTHQGPTWEERNRTALDNQELKSDLRLLWFATGKADFLLGVSRSTVDLFRKHGFNVAYEETSGGHTWINWREYLGRFAPQIFR